MRKIKIGDAVTIKKYIGDEYNERGVVRSIDDVLGLYWVTNMNMPYMGTVSAHFTREEIE